MDIDIHFSRIHLHVEHCYRVPPSRQQGMIGLLHGVGQRAILHPAPVYEEEQAPTIRSIQCWRTHVAPDPQRSRLAVEALFCSRWHLQLLRYHLQHLRYYQQHLLCHLKTQDIHQSIVHLACAHSLQDQTSVLQQGEAQLWISQSIGGDQRQRVGGFGGI